MASVFLGDLNDFIAPSQACVNPLFTAPPKPASEGAAAAAEYSTTNGAGLQLSLEDETALSSYNTTLAATAPVLSKPDLIKTTANQKATVTLNDCLACSGCVTSAETVLIGQQSTAKFLETLKSGAFAVAVLTLSPQSRASLADHFGLPLLDTQARITTLLQRLGVTNVIDASSAGDLCLSAAREELLGRIRADTTANTQHASAWQSPPNSVAVSRTVQIDVSSGQQIAVPPPSPSGPLPLLISACPGWVCYAEKTTPQAIPYMSAVKSPQQVLGELIKGSLAGAWGVPAKAVFHVSVQPCFDRKLEASRLDFYDPDSDTTEVDLVLSTAELLELIEQQLGGSAVTAKQHFVNVPAADLSKPIAAGIPLTAASVSGTELAAAALEEGGSGGYLEHLFRYTAEHQYGVTIPSDQPLQYKQGRNADFKEVELEVNGQVVLRGALAYGFRNMQSILAQMKRHKCKYHIVEIMACPGGCVNGGGQVRPVQETPVQVRERITRVGHRMQENVILRSLDANPLVQQIMQPNSNNDPTSQQRKAAQQRLLLTSYHAVPKLETTNAMLATW